MIEESITKAQQAASLLVSDLLDLVQLSAAAPGILGNATNQYSLELLKEAQSLNDKLMRLR